MPQLPVVGIRPVIIVANDITVIFVNNKNVLF